MKNIPERGDEMKEKLKRALRLFLFFIKIGCFTFGGGWSILAQMQREFCEKREWLTKEELMDITSVGRSVPGIMITNITVIFGYHVGGVLCAVAAVIGVALPSVAILGLITPVYERVRDSELIAHALTGIRAAVIPIILFAAADLRKTALRDAAAYVIAAAALALCLFVKMRNVLIVLCGAAAGLIIMEVRSRHAA